MFSPVQLPVAGGGLGTERQGFVDESQCFMASEIICNLVESEACNFERLFVQEQRA